MCQSVATLAWHVRPCSWSCRRGRDLRSLPHVPALENLGERIFEPGACLKYKFLGSTPDSLRRMPGRCAASVLALQPALKVTRMPTQGWEPPLSRVEEPSRNVCFAVQEKGCLGCGQREHRQPGKTAWRLTKRPGCYPDRWLAGSP